PRPGAAGPSGDTGEAGEPAPRRRRRGGPRWRRSEVPSRRPSLSTAKSGWAEHRMGTLRALLEVNEAPRRGEHPLDEGAGAEAVEELVEREAAGEEVVEGELVSAPPRSWIDGRAGAAGELAPVQLDEVVHRGGRDVGGEHERQQLGQVALGNLELGQLPVPGAEAQPRRLAAEGEVAGIEVAMDQGPRHPL